MLNPKLLKILAALKNSDMPLQTPDLQKMTGLPIAAINKFLWQCRDGMTIPLVARVEVDSNANLFAHEFSSGAPAYSEYKKLLAEAKMNEKEVVASLKGGKVLSIKDATPKATATKKTKKTKKTTASTKAEPAKTKAEPVPTAKIDEGSYRVNRNNVVRAFNSKPGKPMTISKLAAALKVSEESPMIQPVLDTLKEENQVADKKILNSVVYKPIGDIFVDAGNLDPKDIVAASSVPGDSTGSTSTESPASAVAAAENTSSDGFSDIELEIIGIVGSKMLTNKDVINELGNYSSVMVTRALNSLVQKGVFGKCDSVRPSLFGLKDVEAAHKKASKVTAKSSAAEPKGKANKVVQIQKGSAADGPAIVNLMDGVQAGGVPQLLRNVANYMESVQQENEELRARLLESEKSAAK